jgi:Protein of unknown function (DUF2911)
MKKLSLAIAFCLAAGSILAQTKLPGLDKSPADISYCPANYAFREIDTVKTAPLVARLIYSRPQKNGRVIFGGLVPYGKVWRLGANEATEIDIFQPVKINGKTISTGRYTLYAIPDSLGKWTIILNSDTDVWGAFSYDSSKDVVRVDVPVQKQSPVVDALTIVFTKSSAGYDLLIVWDDEKVILPIVY